MAAPVVERELPVDAISIARLHGEACIECGSATAPLIPAGHVGTRDGQGSVPSWAVVMCLKHSEAAS